MSAESPSAECDHGIGFGLSCEKCEIECKAIDDALRPARLIAAATIYAAMVNEQFDSDDNRFIKRHGKAKLAVCRALTLEQVINEGEW